MKTKNEKTAAPGRPSVLKGGKQVGVYLSAESIEQARSAGDGNISAGIRKALSVWQEQSKKGTEEMSVRDHLIDFINKTFGSVPKKRDYGLFEMALLHADDAPYFDEYREVGTTIFDGRKMSVYEVDVGMFRAKGYVNMFEKTTLPAIPGGFDLVLTEKKESSKHQQIPDQPGLAMIYSNTRPGRAVQIHCPKGSCIDHFDWHDYIEITGMLTMHVLLEKETGGTQLSVIFDPAYKRFFDAIGQDHHTKESLGMPTDASDCYFGRIEKIYRGRPGMPAVIDELWQERAAKYRKSSVAQEALAAKEAIFNAYRCTKEPAITCLAALPG